jgi:hypothetical protein
MGVEGPESGQVAGGEETGPTPDPASPPSSLDQGAETPGIVAGVRCTRCGKQAGPTEQRCSACNRFLPKNWSTWSNGLTVDRLPPELQHLAEQVDEFVLATLADEGDAADIPARRKSVLEYRARLHRRILQLDAALELRGLVDSKGKLRVQWLQRLEGLISTALRIDGTLGLERREKRVPSLEEYIASKKRDQENT